MRILVFLLMIYNSCEENVFIENRFPTPKFRDTYTDAELELLAEINNCMVRQNVHKEVVCLGPKCKSYPSEVHLNTTVFKIKTTGISTIKKNDLRNIHSVLKIIIEYNPNLETIEPRCFQNMSAVTQLSISSSPKLISLEENVFEGLINLKELNLNKNGFKRVIFATKALSPKYLPKLNHLQLNENFFINVYKDDFQPMEGSFLNELELFTCQIDYIHPESLNPLVHLQKLRLGENQFNVTVITNLIREIISRKISLFALSFYDAGFRRTLPMPLLEVIGKSNITYLNISRNSFNNLNEHSFPVMPNLRILDLSSCLLLNIAQGTFKNLPNLESLYLADNSLHNIPQAVLLPQIKDLDLSGNSGNPVSKSYLIVDDNTFENMSQMRRLNLNNNLISSVTNLTFIGLINLQYLSFKNGSVFELWPGAFRTLGRLKYLNLENNHVVTLFTAESFEGLDELEILLLGGCYIDDLTAVPSPFYHLKKLKYLGLDRNQLYSIPSTTFPPLVNLVTLDLSNNILTEWSDRLFPNMSLKELDISQNKIKFFTVTMLEDIQYLDKLNIEGNPLTCDCSLFTVSKWLRTNQLTTKEIKHDYNPKCVSPETFVKMSIIDYIMYMRDHSICDDRPINRRVLISVFAVLVACSLIASILGYVYRTHVQHWILLLRLTFRRYFKFTQEKGDTLIQYKYDAFVSYSNEDQDFVINLVTMLENYEPYFKLCVYERDFQIGSGISESVLNSVVASRKTLLIISDAFAKSQWCRWEAKLAEHHHLFFSDSDMKGPCGTLLLVLLNTVSETNMTPTLKYLLRTRIYLEWSSEPEKQEIFWEKLRKKLCSSIGRAFESHIAIQEN